MALQRVCREGGELELHHPPFTRGFPLLAEDGEALFVGMTPVEAGQWGLKAGQKLRMRVVDRGRVYEAITPLEGQGRLEGEPCVRLGVPRLLTVWMPTDSRTGCRRSRWPAPTPRRAWTSWMASCTRWVRTVWSWRPVVPDPALGPSSGWGPTPW